MKIGQGLQNTKYIVCGACVALSIRVMSDTASSAASASSAADSVVTSDGSAPASPPATALSSPADVTVLSSAATEITMRSNNGLLDVVLEVNSRIQGAANTHICKSTFIMKELKDVLEGDSHPIITGESDKTRQW